MQKLLINAAKEKSEDKKQEICFARTNFLSFAIKTALT